MAFQQPMRVTFCRNVFGLTSTFDQRKLAKQAKWRWHGGGTCGSECDACKAGVPIGIWWTPHPGKVADLIEIASAQAPPVSVDVDEKVLADQIARHSAIIPGTHPCAALDCTREVGAGTLMCRHHWFSLTREERNEVWAAWRAVIANSNQETREAHRAVVRKVVDALAARKTAPTEKTDNE